MITGDYHSGFFELAYLSDATSVTVVGKPKKNFIRHRIPHTLITDNGPSFSSAEFSEFVRKWEYVREVGSPGNSQANGTAEAAVIIAKRLLRKCKPAREETYVGLLNKRNTRTEGMKSSQAQRLFGRRAIIRLPDTGNKLTQGGHPVQESGDTVDDRTFSLR